MKPNLPPIQTTKKLVLSIDVGTVNLACCIMDTEGNIHNLSIHNIKGGTYAVMGKKLKDVLDGLDYFMWVEREKGICYELTVVIERQMCRNPKMRIISGQIHMYFIMKQDCNTPKFSIVKIVYYSPKNKLLVYQKQEGDPEIKEPKCKIAYNRRKNLAKQHCNIILLRKGEDTDVYKYFKQSKKKDDISDSFLQGLAYIKGL